MATAAETATATPTPAHDGIVVSDPLIVDITALRKSYGSNEVLKGIDLSVQRPVRSLPSLARAVRAKARCFVASTGWRCFRKRATAASRVKKR